MTPTYKRTNLFPIPTGLPHMSVIGTLSPQMDGIEPDASQKDDGFKQCQHSEMMSSQTSEDKYWDSMLELELTQHDYAILAKAEEACAKTSNDSAVDITMRDDDEVSKDGFVGMINGVSNGIKNAESRDQNNAVPLPHEEPCPLTAPQLPLQRSIDRANSQGLAKNSRLRTQQESPIDTLNQAVSSSVNPSWILDPTKDNLCSTFERHMLRVLGGWNSDLVWKGDLAYLFLAGVRSVLLSKLYNLGPFKDHVFSISGGVSKKYDRVTDINNEYLKFWFDYAAICAAYEMLRGTLDEVHIYIYTSKRIYGTRCNIKNTMDSCEEHIRNKERETGADLNTSIAIIKHHFISAVDPLLTIRCLPQSPKIDEWHSKLSILIFISKEPRARALGATAPSWKHDSEGLYDHGRYIENVIWMGHKDRVRGKGGYRDFLRDAYTMPGFQKVLDKGWLDR